MKKIIVAVLLVSLLLVALPAVAAETEDVQTEGYARMMGTREGKGLFGHRGGMKDADFEPDPEVAAERINQAVEDGRLTQERADEMLEKLEAGEWPIGERDRDREMERDLELIAEHIAQAVEDGKLSQERADEMLERLEEGLPLGRPGFKGHGGRGLNLDEGPDA